MSASSLPTLTNSIGMKLVQIPAGRFSMGSPASEPGSEEHEVLHKVELTQAYYLGITEVTEHQWALVMEDAFRTEVREVRDKETNRLIRKEEVQIRNPKLDSQRPITNVSWVQAVEFCQRLSQLPEEKKEGRQYRLPTEAEWEQACRAGTASAYSFGDDRSMLGTYGWQGVNQAQPVGQKKPNAWGLYDMHGNAAEWCFDFYGTYPEDLVSDPIGPEQLVSLDRVIRGGDFSLEKEYQCRSAWRSKASADWKASTLGFRVGLGVVVGIKDLPSVVNSIGQRLVTIPAGRFMMGSDKGDSDERPVHEVTISKAFAIGSTEVTQSQWKAVMGTEPWKGEYYVTEGADYPATYISWDDAVKFCQRLSALPEERSAGRVYRLPTESEWEYACRAGSPISYHFGDDADDLLHYAWFVSNSESKTQPVGQKRPNEWGLYDMHGNVWEWCSDRYGEYPDGVVTDPVGPSRGSDRVFRGGGWGNVAADCRSAFRFRGTQVIRNFNLGFRLALSSPSEIPK